MANGGKDGGDGLLSGAGSEPDWDIFVGADSGPSETLLDNDHGPSDRLPFDDMSDGAPSVGSAHIVAASDSDASETWPLLRRGRDVARCVPAPPDDVIRV